MQTTKALDDTQAIAEEGSIYGLPIVMNYAVMYEYSVDRNSGQFKAPFNQINNEARVFTYEDTSVHAKRRHTVFDLVALRPWRLLRNSLRYLCVLGVSAVEKCAPDLYRRDPENAEVAQRSSFKSFICFYQKQASSAVKFFANTGTAETQRSSAATNETNLQ